MHKIVFPSPLRTERRKRVDRSRQSKKGRIGSLRRGFIFMTFSSGCCMNLCVRTPSLSVGLRDPGTREQALHRLGSLFGFDIHVFLRAWLFQQCQRGINKVKC